MHVTLLIKPNFKQLVFTPESKEEKQIFKMFPTGDTVPFTIKRGSCFAKCGGGWVREFPDEDSLMFTVSTDHSK